ncbi:MFS transporter [Flavobacterium sp. DGU38]|uniref:MFS transporter n=1 Tax=Flavobacterium calami TaxID=3139144 RepID=A0ABU9IJ71_9FLAO
MKIISVLRKSYLENYSGFPKEIWILALITFINRTGTMVIPFLSKYMRENLHFEYNQIGWVMVCFGVGSFIGTWLSGVLSDKFGFYKVMIGSLFGSGIVFFMLQYTTSFEGFCVSILLLTTIADMFRPAMLVSLNTYTRKENKTRALALVRAATSLGFLFGPPLGGLIIILIGYKYLFYVDSATCILAVIVFVLLVKERKLPFKLKTSNFGVDKYAILKDRTFITHMFISLITGIMYFQVFTTLTLYHKEQFNLSEVNSGLLLSFSGILTLLFELPIVNYVEKNKMNKLNVIMLGLSFMVLSYILLLLNDKWYGILYLMMFFMTLGVMLTFPFANSFAMTRSHTKQEGRYMSVFTMSFSLAHVLSAKTGMEIVAYASYRADFIFMSLIGLLAISLCYWLVKIVEKEKIETKIKIVQSIFVDKSKKG